MPFQSYKVKTEAEKQAEQDAQQELVDKAKKQTHYYQQDMIQEMQEKEIDRLLSDLQSIEEKGKSKYQEKVLRNDLRQSKQESSQESFLAGDNQDVPIDGDLNHGSRIFMRHCAHCHALNANSKGRKTAGPALGIVYGKRAGQDHYYNHYSYPLVAADFLWSKYALFNFFKAPQAFLPVINYSSVQGTRCDINKGKGLADPNDRADLIKFFKQYTRELQINIRVKSEKSFGKDFVNKEVSAKYQMQHQAQ